MKNVSNLNDFFIENRNVCYGVAINTYDDEIHTFLIKYYSAAIKCGTVIENKIENPTNEQIAYMNDTIGTDFNLDSDFIVSKLQKWLQTLTLNQSKTLSTALCSVLTDLKQFGKNDSALKNAYIKFMCWLYYRFRSVLNQIGKLPKILYEGVLTNYELYMLELLFRCGCDIVILDYGIQDKVKQETMFPQYVNTSNENKNKFPSGFSIKTLKEEILAQQKMNNICGPKSNYQLCRNAWLSNTVIDEIKRTERMSDKNLICSSFLMFNGVNDRNNYINTLYKLYDEIPKTRKITILNNGVPVVTPSEINELKRTNCKNVFDVISFTLQNVNVSDIELSKYMKYVFAEYFNKTDVSIQKLQTMAATLIALIKRYQSLFNMKSPGCLFILETETAPLKEQDFMLFDLLSYFPIDIIIFNPAKIDNIISLQSCLTVTYDDSLKLDKFPTESVNATISTTAYNAENDLTTMLYQDSGIYRNRQYKKAEPILLKTMYEEIEILWNETLSMRPGFSIDDDKVTMPTIFAKVCGVKNSNKKAYVKSIEHLVMDNPNVIYVKNHFVLPPYTKSINIASIMQNGKISIDKVKEHKAFKYAYLRDETIAFMVDKLQYFIDSKAIDGVGTNGNENIFVELFFNLPKDIINLIQKFDFTKINPKIVYLNTTENILKLDETMLIQYLSFLGFDIVMFIPTGYNTIENYFTKRLFTEYQIGDYMYNLSLDIKKKKGFFGF